MRCSRNITLKDGTTALIRNLEKEDAAAAIWILRQTAAQTPFLLREPEECAMTIAQEKDYIARVNDSAREVLVGAFAGNELVGMANLSQVAPRARVRHRAGVGVSLLRAYWGKGIGTAMMRVLIDAAKAAGFEQLELEVVENNDRARAMYGKLGFSENGRIPRAMKYRNGEYADLIQMVLYL